MNLFQSSAGANAGFAATVAAADIGDSDVLPTEGDAITTAWAHDGQN